MQRGQVVAVRDVVIQPASGGQGAGEQIGAGTAVGVITGSPSAIVLAVGRVIGGKVGAQADARAAEEITVDVQGGQRIIVVQERSDPPFASGEIVEVQTTAAGPANRAMPAGVPAGTVRIVRPMQFDAAAVAADFPRPRAR